MMANDFAINMAAYVEKTKLKLEAVSRELVVGLGKRIVDRSPVGNPDLWLSLHPVVSLKTHKISHGKAPAGYRGGLFRGNWQYAFGAPPTASLKTIDPTGTVSIDRITGGVAAAAPFGKHFIINCLPYAIRLEYGWSTQAPQGMVRLAVQDTQQAVKDAVKGASA